MTDRSRASQPQPTTRSSTAVPVPFDALLRRSPQLASFPDEAAYTPPVPRLERKPGATASDPRDVVVFAYGVSGLPPAGFRILPPTHEVVATWPTADVRSVVPTSASQLGLELVDGRTLGQNDVPALGAADQARVGNLVAQRVAFTHASATLLDAFFGGSDEEAVPYEACRNYLLLLPAQASAPLVPLLRRTSPRFFAMLDRCVAGGEGKS